jgi:hypothetical protein
MILDQLDKCDCMFVCETWLKPSDLGCFRNELVKHNYWSQLKSSIDADVTLEGRPYGGVGFLCKRISGMTYVPIACDNDRICAIQIVVNNKVILTVIGVYMPYHDGSSSQMCLYNDTLEDVQ